MLKTVLVHGGLLVATAASTFATYAMAWSGGADLADRAVDAALFTGCALLILGAHEMGHYLMARRHGVEASLPYFIPLPLLGFGTLGAVIRLRGRVPTRDALVDIGAAGPLAGALVALPLTVTGLLVSTVAPSPPGEDAFPPNLSLWGLASLAGQSIRASLDGRTFEVPWAVQLFGENALTLLTQRLVLGPLPAGHDVYAHPVFVAAWFGLLVTMLNLLPIGQLDGGHLTHAWLGERAVRLGRWVAGALLLVAFFFSAGWLVWFFVATRVVGFRHPEVLEPAAPLSLGRKWVCAVSLALLALTFMPAPLGVR